MSYDYTTAHRNPAGREQMGGGGLFAFLFVLPLLLITLTFGLIAYIMARLGVRYRLVKLMVLPASLITSNMVAILLFGTGAFLWSAFSGDKFAINYFFGNIRDLSLYPIWGPIVSWFWDFGVRDFTPTTDPMHIWAYQLIVYMTIGFRLRRHIAMSLYDLAIVRAALRSGTNPSEVRLIVAERDEKYTKDAQVYSRKGIAPLLGLILIALFGCNPGHFYSP